MKQTRNRADGSPFGTHKDVKKPKGLSWNGHLEALAVSRPFRAVGKGQQAYRVAAIQLVQVERLLRDGLASEAKPKRPVTGNGHSGKPGRKL